VPLLPSVPDVPLSPLVPLVPLKGYGINATSYKVVFVNAPFPDNIAKEVNCIELPTNEKFASVTA
jgi:hypothetical protein